MEDKLTFKQVYDGVTRTIKKSYTQKNIYRGNIAQNLENGSFNVIPISATDIAELGDRIKRTVTFDCMYYAAEDDYAELLEIADNLPLVLSMIEIASNHVLHGTFNTPTAEIEDGVVHCIVSYTFFGFVHEVLPEGEESATDLMYYLEQKFTEVKQ